VPVSERTIYSILRIFEGAFFSLVDFLLDA
jgi:hypothetical protein